MNNSIDQASDSRRRINLGVVAILVSATIAILIATGMARPYPDLKFAYLICAAVGVFGLIQLIVVRAGSTRR